EMEPFQSKLQNRARLDALADSVAKQRRLPIELAEDRQRRVRLQARLMDSANRAVWAQREVHTAYQTRDAERLGGGAIEIARDVTLTAATNVDSSAFLQQLQEGLDGRQKIDALVGLDPATDSYRFRAIEEHCANLSNLLTELSGPDSERR